LWERNGLDDTRLVSQGPLPLARERIADCDI